MVQAAQQSIDAVEALRQSIVELNHSFRRIAEENQALPYRLAIDVGANRGDVSERLLQAGIEVYAFEPFSPMLKRLQERLANNPYLHSLPYALGAADETRDLHVAADLTENEIYSDPTFYRSLGFHFLAEGLVFKESVGRAPSSGVTQEVL